MSTPDFDLCETEDAYQLCTPDQGLSCRFTGRSVLLFNAEFLSYRSVHDGPFSHGCRHVYFKAGYYFTFYRWSHYLY